MRKSTDEEIPDIRRVVDKLQGCHGGGRGRFKMELAVVLEKLPHHSVFIYRELVSVWQRNQIMIGIEEAGSGRF
jgi:hypothetical protein